MLTLEGLRYILCLLTFGDWEFYSSNLGDGFYLQLIFKIDGEPQKSRKWYISKHSTRSEVVQTAFKAVMTALEHEARESFKYDGQAIFGPHFDIEALFQIAEEKRTVMRA